jgi:DNA-binding HxlR family transcriptional regulator
MTNRGFGQTCSIAGTLEIVGDRWTLLILRDLFRGLHRFDEIQQNLGIARNILTVRLGKLRDEGIVETRPYRGPRGVRDAYHLTDRGKALHPIMLAMMQFGDRHVWTDGLGPPVHIRHRDCDHRTDAGTLCSHCGQPLTADSVDYLPNMKRFAQLGTRADGS